jgi:hypothetical protein
VAITEAARTAPGVETLISRMQHSQNVAAAKSRKLYSRFSEIVKSTTVGSLALTFTFFVQVTGEL